MKKNKISKAKPGNFILLALMILALSLLVIINPGSKSNNALALNNGLALTPPMGWNSWNLFRGNINETLIKGIADAMVSSGMQAAGYQYVNLDDNWMANPARDANGYLIPDPTRFPSGMKALADYIHSKGLKIGIYGDHGSKTCMGIPGSGSYGYEQRDANTFASWGIDYLKYDNCNVVSGSNMQTDYTNMSNALLNCGRPIVFSICAWQYQPWMPSVGNLWRTTGDISASWSSICSIIDKNAGLASAAGPGHWNDPDMLEVGNGSLTDDNNKAHFSMWAIMAAPLICGNDIRNMSTAVKNVLTNTEIIDVDQDPLGYQGTRVVDNGNQEVWMKPCQNNVKVVALFNRDTAASASMTVNWSNIGISGNATVRDLWAKTDRGTYNGSYTTTVNAGGVAMLRIVPISGGTPAPSPTPTRTPTLTPGSISSGHTYIITAKHSGKAVVVLSASTSNNAAVIQYTYADNGVTNDEWTLTDLGAGIYKVINVNSGKAMVVQNASTAAGALIIQYTYNATHNDEWKFVNAGSGYYYIVNNKSGLYLNLPGSSTSNSVQFDQAAFTGGDNQKFSLTYLR